MAIVDKPSDYFNTVLYTGDGGTQSITGVGFQPDWTWIKRRSGVAESWHQISDSVRGAGKIIHSNVTNAESTQTNNLTSFDTDGFSVGNGDVNNSSAPFVSWNWKAGTAFTNDASGTGIGSIDSAGSVNTDAGFSIVSWTGTGANGTIKHGLSTVPKMIIIKNRTDAINWIVYHNKIGNTGAVFLDVTNGTDPGAAYFNNTSPTNSVFSVGNYNGSNGSNDNMIAYCFADVQGYSKFGSYVGNGNANGTFIYTGFKPAFVMVKRTDATNYWFMFDNKRSTSGSNPTDKELYANDAAAEDTSARFDFLSNGFKNRLTSAGSNASGGTYIYMAFAENPFTTSTANGSIPATAR